MVLERDAYLPPLIGIATLNRGQMIFLVVLYGAWLVTQRRLSRRTVGLLVSCVMAYTVVFLGLRLCLGFKPSRYTAAYHIAANTSKHNLLEKIVPSGWGRWAGLC
jgi:Gpi18-like mannosyltransferase